VLAIRRAEADPAAFLDHSNRKRQPQRIIVDNHHRPVAACHLQGHRRQTLA
jgi:hypothetical protein